MGSAPPAFIRFSQNDAHSLSNVRNRKTKTKSNAVIGIGFSQWLKWPGQAGGLRGSQGTEPHRASMGVGNVAHFMHKEHFFKAEGLKPKKVAMGLLSL